MPSEAMNSRQWILPDYDKVLQVLKIVHVFYRRDVENPYILNCFWVYLDSCMACSGYALFPIYLVCKCALMVLAAC